MMNAHHLLEKYGITDHDLHVVLSLQEAKSNVGFLKKRIIQQKILAVLDLYSIRFMDLGALLKQIESTTPNKREELRQRFGAVDYEELASSKGSKYFLPASVGLIFVLVLGFLVTSLVLLLAKDANPSTTGDGYFNGNGVLQKSAGEIKYFFKSTGRVEVCEWGSEEYWDRSCCSEGNWRVEDALFSRAVVIVEGVSNDYCPWVKELNGRFTIGTDNVGAATLIRE